MQHCRIKKSITSVHPVREMSENMAKRKKGREKERNKSGDGKVGLEKKMGGGGRDECMRRGERGNRGLVEKRKRSAKKFQSFLSSLICSEDLLLRK